MRIISGAFGSKKIYFPRNLPVRPTTDYAKSGLFNILNNYFDFPNVKVLDLFAGSGNITYEFISRGCKNITAVDINYNCVKFIKDSLLKLTANDASVYKASAFTFLNQCMQTFDIIFADPPYNLPDVEKFHSLIYENQLVNKNGWFVLEHASDKDFKNLSHFKEKRVYGNVSFSIFVKIYE